MDGGVCWPQQLVVLAVRQFTPNPMDTPFCPHWEGFPEQHYGCSLGWGRGDLCCLHTLSFFQVWPLRAHRETGNPEGTEPEQGDGGRSPWLLERKSAKELYLKRTTQWLSTPSLPEERPRKAAVETESLWGGGPAEPQLPAGSGRESGLTDVWPDG